MLPKDCVMILEGSPKVCEVNMTDIFGSLGNTVTVRLWFFWVEPKNTPTLTLNTVNPREPYFCGEKHEQHYCLPTL